MEIKPDEIAKILRERIEGLDTEGAELAEVGTVLSVADGIARAVSGAEPELVNFLELLAEKHRMPVIFRIRDRFDELWAEENRQLEVRLTSAVELDPEVIKRVRAEIERQTDRKIELESSVDEGIIGGLVLQVGNMVVDASLRGRLERLRKEVAQAALT